MVAIRAFFLAATAALGLGVCTTIAYADPPPWAHGHGRRSEDGSARAHAAISGTIVGVDYLSASILVATPHGVVPVAVTPSTGIYRGNAFASFADIGRGARVEIDAADVNGRLIAQFIRIR